MDQNMNQEQGQVQPPADPGAPSGDPGAPSGPVDASKKLPAGLCGILLGSLGIHKFILGYNTEGIIMLAVSLGGGLVTCGAASGIVGIIGLIEGILYLVKSDEEFYETYIKNKKAWF